MKNQSIPWIIMWTLLGLAIICGFTYSDYTDKTNLENMTKMGFCQKAIVSPMGGQTLIWVKCEEAK